MAHYYWPDGRTAYDEAPEGKPTTLREARKHLLVPGVTTYLGAMPKDHLAKYRARELFLHTPLADEPDWRATIQKAAGEGDDEYFNRLWEAADTHAKNARDKGQDIHKAIEGHTGLHGESFHKKLAELGWDVVWQEKTVVAPDYAGTADLLVRDKFGQFILLDPKGQEWDPNHAQSHRRKPSAYNDYVVQLAAYAKACDEEISGLCSPIFHRQNPGMWHFHVWSAKEMVYGWELFKAMKEFWKILHKYDVTNPGRFAA